MAVTPSTVSPCPNCGVDLSYKVDGDDRTYYRTIGIYDRNRDRTVAWHCPDCGHQWDRFVRRDPFS